MVFTQEMPNVLSVGSESMGDWCTTAAAGLLRLFLKGGFHSKLQL